MKAPLFVLSVFATLSAVDGLPTTDARAELSLTKRAELPYDSEDYRKCLMEEFDDILKANNKWQEITCSNNKNIKFKVEKGKGWNSALDCHRWGKDGLLDQILGGQTLAKKRLCSSEGIIPYSACCYISVDTKYPTKDYANCLKKEFKTKAYDQDSWGDVVCPNKDIMFSVTRESADGWQSPKDCYHDGIETFEKMIEEGTTNGGHKVCPPDNKPGFCCYLSVQTRDHVGATTLNPDNLVG